MTTQQALKQYFGYDTFREGQSGLISALLGGRDALGVMPTGMGKSICYQLPALLLPGVTLVISPLISLMRDQVQALTANGIAAAYINSSLTAVQLNRAMENARDGAYKVIYVAPERLLAPSLLAFAQAAEIALIAVDEAHCISQWGQDFRPSYLDIPQFVAGLPRRPVLAGFTATATPRVRDDVIQTLGLQQPLLVTTGFDRPNLYFEVQRPEDKYAALQKYLKSNDGAGIVYCSTRKEVEKVSEKLNAGGYGAAGYHAGLPGEARSAAQDDFLYDRVRIIVATNAFGMGIDKSNVRFVIHYNMPQNIESYYQEAGRAGRDGLPSDCVLFYARKDIMTAVFLINQSENPEEVRRKKHLLDQMESYCETDGCLRGYILRYFGEEMQEDCGNCSNCKGIFSETDVTVDAQKVLSCIARINKQNRAFGYTVIEKVLRGKADDFITSRQLDQLPTFGAMEGARQAYVRRVFDRLVALGCITMAEGEYRTAYLAPQARKVLFDGAAVLIRGEKPKAKQKMQRDEPRYAVAQDLMEKLRALRLEIAKAGGVPAFVIFSDATLVDMCQKHPQNEEEMLRVSGVGEVKFERYGEAFLQVLRAATPSVQVQETRPELTAAQLREQVEISDTPISINRVADCINAVLLQAGKQKTSGQALNKLLESEGFIQTTDAGKLPTAKGLAAGVTVVTRTGVHGEFLQCLFGSEMQALCVALAGAGA
ncbi:MAG: DNA helicase RecQ [Oscillospiraceae bacterium]|nr:DNA helicase RecQ [Oscillospiraceae bacterium]